jgi:hypothetical protein
VLVVQSLHRLRSRPEPLDEGPVPCEVCVQDLDGHASAGLGRVEVGREPYGAEPTLAELLPQEESLVDAIAGGEEGALAAHTRQATELLPELIGRLSAGPGVDPPRDQIAFLLIEKGLVREPPIIVPLRRVAGARRGT